MADPNRRPAGLAAPLITPALVAPRVISPQNVWIMDDMMADVIKRGTGIRAGLALHRSDISGKTGTTNEARDTWFNGFNRNIVRQSGWLRSGASLGEGEEGSRTAVPIWVDFMREALRAQPDRMRPMPSGLVTARISPKTGHSPPQRKRCDLRDVHGRSHADRRQCRQHAAGCKSQNPGSSSEPLF